MTGALFWVSGGEWKWTGHYFGWMKVGGDKWGWVGVSGGGCTV